MRSVKPVGVRNVERDEAVFFGGPGIIDLVEFVPSTKFRADGVPEQLHQLDPLFGIIATRAANVLVEVGAQGGIVEVPRTGVEIDQAAGHTLFNQVLDDRIKRRGKDVVG